MQPNNSPHEQRGLTLSARNDSGIHTISAYLQDALVPVASMHFNHETATFHFLANRFCWELYHQPDHHWHYTEDGHPIFYRTHTGIGFHHVIAVHGEGFSFRDWTKQLSLLAIRVLEDQSIVLVFSDQATVRLTVSALECRFADQGESWPTHTVPQHTV